MKRDKLDKLAGLSPEMQKGLRDKLDKLAGASPELQKGLATAAKIHDMLADGKRRLDDLRKQMDEVGAPINGTYHGLQAFNKLTKKG